MCSVFILFYFIFFSLPLALKLSLVNLFPKFIARSSFLQLSMKSFQTFLSQCFRQDHFCTKQLNPKSQIMYHVYSIEAKVSNDDLMRAFIRKKLKYLRSSNELNSDKKFGAYNYHSRSGILFSKDSHIILMDS